MDHHSFLNHLYLMADNPVLLFIIMFVSGLGNMFFPPIPIEAGTVFAGYLVSIGHASIIIIITATSTGMFLGSLLLYVLAKKFSESIFSQKPFSKLITKKSYERMRLWFEKYGVWSLFAAKFVPGMNFCAVFCTGVLKLSKTKTVLGLLASNLLFFSLLTLAGKYAGENWEQVYKFFGKLGIINVLIICIAGISIYVYYKFYKKKQTPDSSVNKNLKNTN